jgi:hypothetical protein
VALNTKNQIQSIKSIQYSTSTEAPFGQLIKQKVSKKLLLLKTIFIMMTECTLFVIYKAGREPMPH